MKGVKIVIKERTEKVVQGTLFIDAEGAGKYSDVGPIWSSVDEFDILVNMIEMGCSEDVQFILEDVPSVDDY